MSLRDYLRNGWIQGHEPSGEEIRDLLSVADRDIVESQVRGLGAEWRFDIAYNSALQSATAALAASGHRASRENKHMRVVESLTFTLGVSAEETDFLDACRRKRHAAVYEQVGGVSDREAVELIQFAKGLRHRVEVWIRSSHPGLLQ